MILIARTEKEYIVKGLRSAALLMWKSEQQNTFRAKHFS